MSELLLGVREQTEPDNVQSYYKSEKWQQSAAVQRNHLICVCVVDCVIVELCLMEPVAIGWDAFSILSTQRE